jgi:alanine racemase
MGPRALIDLAALKHNLDRARQSAPGSRVIAVIKSNAYGHGMLRAAEALADADAFAVARVEEGVTLRQAGIDKTINVLEGAMSVEEQELAARHDLGLTIHTDDQLDWLEQSPPSRPVSCWLKMDTGMHRLGFEPQRVAEVWNRLQGIAAVRQPLRLMTHLANADDRSDQTTLLQLERFQPLAEQLAAETSIANSAAILGWPQAHGDWVRPGIMLYGASPFLDGSAEQDGLMPVMTLETRLIAVKEYPAGAPVGYGGTWRCPEAMRIGVAAIGYGDGYPRHAPSGTPVLVNNRRAPLVGRVSMDMITLDLRDQPEARAGDPVILWGRGLPADEIARRAGTIAYELFCGVTRRVEFSYSEEAGKHP